MIWTINKIVRHQFRLFRIDILFTLFCNLFLATGCSDAPVSKDVAYVTKNEYVGILKIPADSRAQLSEDMLTVDLQLHNTTQYDLLILPSLLFVDLADSTWIVPSYDAMGVMLYGMNSNWRAGMFDDMLFFDNQYRLQFIEFKQDSHVSISYKVPMNLFAMRKMDSIKYLHGLELPVWDLHDSLVMKYVSNSLHGTDFDFDHVLVPLNGVRFSDRNVVNMGTRKWTGAINFTKQEFYRMADRKLADLVDESSESMMVVYKGKAKNFEPRHIKLDFQANEQLQTAIRRAEHEAQK